MLSSQRVGIFIAALAVPLVKSCRVLREVRGNPVENYAYSRLVALIDKCHKVVRRSEARSWRVIAYLLISPRAVERIFSDRHKLDVSIAHFLNIRNKLVCELLVAEIILAVFLPRTRVNLVNINRAVVNVRFCKLFLIRFVRPLEAVEVEELRRGVRTKLHMSSVRVGFQLYQTVGGFNAEFVVVILLYPLDKQLPDTAVVDFIHIMTSSVPVVKIADNANRLRVRRPAPKHNTVHSVLFQLMRAEKVVGM